MPEQRITNLRGFENYVSGQEKKGRKWRKYSVGNTYVGFLRGRVYLVFDIDTGDLVKYNPA